MLNTIIRDLLLIGSIPNVHLSLPSRLRSAAFSSVYSQSQTQPLVVASLTPAKRVLVWASKSCPSPPVLIGSPNVAHRLPGAVVGQLASNHSTILFQNMHVLLGKCNAQWLIDDITVSHQTEPEEPTKHINKYILVPLIRPPSVHGSHDIISH